MRAIPPKSVWWRWTAPATGSTVASTAGSNFNTTLSVYSGSGIGDLLLVGENDDSGGATSRVAFTAQAGVTYLVAVDGHDGNSGTVALSIAGSTAPVNDAFSAAALLTGSSVSAAGTNVGATKETGEPSHAGKSGGKSVWWYWVAPETGSFVIATTGSSFDTTLGVYTGAAVNGLATIASNDDSNGTSQSQVTISATAGVTYRIAVDGYSAASGSIQLRINAAAPPAPPPPNDNFAAAIAVPGDAPTANGSNASSTAETGEPAHYGRTAVRSIWWTWTAPADGFASASTAGSNFDTVLAIYTGSSVDALTAVVSNDDSNGTNQSQVSFAVTAGVTYAIAVDSYSSATTGNVSLAINGPLPAPSVSVQKTGDAAERPRVSGSLAVSLSIAQPRETIVILSLGGTARAGLDFATSPATSNGTIAVTFAPLQTQATITFAPIADDDLLEFDETILVTSPAGQSATVLVHDDTPYDAAWAAAAGPAFTGAAAAPGADPDGDGRSNLLEDAFGSSPTAADAAASQPLPGVGEYPDEAGESHSYVTITFPRRLSSSLRYSVLGSGDLATWSADGIVLVATTTANVPAGFELVTYRAPQPLDAGAFFLRVNVEWP